MSDDDYNVYQDEDGMWKGKRQGADRPAVSADTQREAFERTREHAKNKGSDVAIHRGDNGRIRAKHSYGNDPEETKG